MSREKTGKLDQCSL